MIKINYNRKKEDLSSQKIFFKKFLNKNIIFY